MAKIPDQSVDGFYIKQEDPPKTKRRGKQSIYVPRIEKVKTLPPGWYVIGHWNNGPSSAATSAVQYLRVKFKEMEFAAWRSDDKKSSKLYCRVKPTQFAGYPKIGE